MPGVWQINDECENKYLVQRRDGTVPNWPWLVLGAKDPAVPEAIRCLSKVSRDLGMDSQYCDDLLILADKFESFRLKNGVGDPDAEKHRIDSPEIIKLIASRELE